MQFLGSLTLMKSNFNGGHDTNELLCISFSLKYKKHTMSACLLEDEI